MSCERGQASVEWIGLLLLVAAALAGLVALAPRVEGRSLGGLVAHRIACTARGDCVAGGAGTLAAPPNRARGTDVPAVVAPGRIGPARGAGARGSRRGRARAPGRVGPSGGAGAREPAAARRLAGVRRVAGALAKRAWIACMGYRRYRYERDHPGRLSPFDPLPVGDAFRMVDRCLNPLGFLRSD